MKSKRYKRTASTRIELQRGIVLGPLIFLDAPPTSFYTVAPNCRYRGVNWSLRAALGSGYGLKSQGQDHTVHAMLPPARPPSATAIAFWPDARWCSDPGRCVRAPTRPLARAIRAVSLIRGGQASTPRRKFLTYNRPVPLSKAFGWRGGGSYVPRESQRIRSIRLGS